MKIYSDKLMIQDLSKATPDDVVLEATKILKPRIRERGWNVYLKGLGRRHTRATGHRPIGSYSLADYPRAATWDDWGIWMSELFKIDPDARIGNDDGVEAFLMRTTRYQPQGAKAPWLTDPKWVEFMAVA